MLVVVDFGLFYGLVFVIEAEKRSYPKAEEHAQQEKNHDRCDAGHQPVGNHGKPLPLYFSSSQWQEMRGRKTKRPACGGPFKTENWQLRTGFTGVLPALLRVAVRSERSLEASLP